MHPVIANAMRLQAQRAGGKVIARIALVTSYDPDNYAARVALQPEGTLTGWLPIASLWVGDGWGLYSPPSVNEQVTVLFVNGDLEAGYVQGRFFNNEDRPLSVPSGEFWVVHQTGSVLKFHNDGTVELITDSDLNVTVGGTLNATVAGDASVDVTGDATLTANTATVNAPTTINGTLTVSETVTCSDLITNAMTSANAHVHGGVSTGGSNTGGPSG